MTSRESAGKTWISWTLLNIVQRKTPVWSAASGLL
jgi:hypothetical protein